MVISTNQEDAPEGMVNSWEAKKAEILSQCRVRVTGLPGVTAQIVDIKHPLEDNPNISLQPIYRRANYATPTLREQRMLSFIPKIQAFEGKIFATFEELHQAIRPLKEELDEHWTNCNETSADETPTLIAEANITAECASFKIRIYRVGDMHKLDLTIGY